MRRLVLIVSCAFGALIFIAAFGAVFLFNTGAGRNLIASQLEARLGDAFDGDAQIGSLTGALPGTVVLNNIQISDENGPWLVVQRLELKWRPFALTGKKIDVERLAVDGAHLSRPPPARKKTNDEREPRSFKLPADLPSITVDALDISNFHADLDGATQRLDGTGAFHISEKRINIRANVASSGGADKADIVVVFAPDRDRIFIDAALEAQKGGVIAALANLNSDVSLEAKSDSPINDADIKLNGEIADYGAISANLKINLEKRTDADIELTFTPSESLVQTPEFAVPVTAEIGIEGYRNGGAATIKDLQSALGRISGVIDWTTRGDTVRALNADLSLEFAKAYRPDVQRAFGPAPTLTGALKRRGGGYGLTARASTERFRFQIDNGRTDLRKTLSGDIALTFAPVDGAPAWLSESVALTAVLDADFDRELSLRALSGKLDDGSAAKGEARYSFIDSSLAANADIVATPALLAALPLSVNASDSVEANIVLSGKPNDLALRSSIKAPALRIGDNAVPALFMNVALAGLPKSPAGEFSAHAIGTERGRFLAQIRPSASGGVAFPSLLYASDRFRLDGDGTYDPAAQTAQIDLAYEGRDDAQPWPGVTLVGDLKMNGVLSRDGALNNFIATSTELRANDVSLSGLSLAAQGPPGASRVSVNADAVSTPRLGVVDNLSVSAVVDAGDPLTITLNAAAVGDGETRLTKPATIRFDNGVAVDNFRLAYGAKGAVAIDGVLSPEQWRARAVFTEVGIPNADAQISFNIDLDTDRATPAQGAFQLRALLVQNETAALDGAFVWDGQTITLTSAKDAEGTDMRFVLPARLEKTPTIALDMSGPLEGYARYDGPVQVIAAYLPPVLQTLEGALRINLTLDGNTTAPRLAGHVEVADGEYTELQSGFSLSGLHLKATVQYAEAGSVVAFSGGARGVGRQDADTIAFNGDITIDDSPALNLTATFSGAELSAHPVKRVRADGRIDVAGPFDAIKAAGDIKIEELDVEIITPENNGLVDIDVVTYSRSPTEQPVPSEPASALDYEIAVSADDRIFIRGRGLESEWSADAIIMSAPEGALITGVMNLRRGWLDFSGRRFDLTTGVIAFDRLSPNDPVLDIRAEFETSGVTAVIAVSGRASEPNIALLSTPSLPSEDIMALVLFGKPAEELSAVESLQAAQALAALGGVGPFGGEGITGSLRQAIGLDLLNIDIDPENGGGSLTVGKYVADGFFVSASQDVEGQNGSVSVEYEITDNITVETQIEQDGDQTVSANWKRDF